AYDRLPQRLALIYSNRRPEDAAFLEELGHLQEDNPNFLLAATMTRMRDSTRTWQGQIGAIDDKLLAKACTGLTAPIYYVAGPPAMVEWLCQMLELAGIMDDDVRSEAFFGY
ncbi:MAG: oxidoreductase, partial [Terriglobia bacterium]